jgi:excisionase family DNA binding protein
MSHARVLMLSTEELDALITQAVAAGVTRALREAAPAPLLTQSELAEHLKVSPYAITRLVTQGLPYLHVGTERRFQLSAVKAFLADLQRSAH